MHKLNLAKRWVILGAAAAVVVGLVGLGVTTLASAQGDDGNTIHACVQSQRGLLRIVEAGEECQLNEVALEWNAEGEVGPQGPEGPEGPAGPPGPGLSGYEMVMGQGNLTEDPWGQCYGSAVAKCPLGKKVLGGGGEFYLPDVYFLDPVLVTSFPRSSDGQDEWVVIGRASTCQWDEEVFAYAICATVP